MTCSEASLGYIGKFWKKEEEIFGIGNRAGENRCRREKKGALNLREEFETDGIRVKDRNRGGSVRVFPDLKEKTKQRT